VFKKLLVLQLSEKRGAYTT